ncbi:MAG: hypothetical protein Q7T50_06565 [Candidatus Magasanikbacteria bacterium]|nr:hypothetical protein [Candidatus Magasanikbacteria bacterium]
MRRRLKTTKKDKKEPIKAGQKKPALKKEKAIVPEKVERKGMQIRVIGHPRVKSAEEIRVEEKREFALSKEEEIARKLEAARQQEIERNISPEAKVQALVRTAVEIDRKKQIIMWCGIAFCMILITFFWINNTRRVVEESRDEINRKNDLSTEWDDAVNELSDKIVELKNGVDSIDAFGKSTTTSGKIATSTLSDILRNASTSPSLPENDAKNDLLELDKEEFEKINQKIEPEIKNKIRFIY